MSKRVSIYIDDYMSALFVKSSLEKLNEPVSGIKICEDGTHKFIAQLTYYTTTAAERAKHNLPGNVIPYSCPPKYIKLVKESPKEYTECHIMYISDMQVQFCNFEIYERLKQKYASAISVKQYRDLSNKLTGKACIGFENKFEMVRAVNELKKDSSMGLGCIKCSKTSFDDEENNDKDILIDPEYLSFDEMNTNYMKSSEEFYSTLEESRWNPVNTNLSQIAITPRM